MRIFKYQIGVRHGRVRIPMPKGAMVLSAASQAGNPVIWAMVAEGDDCTPPPDMEYREFVVRMTGEGFVVSGRERFIGTILLERDSFVMHIFECER